MSFDLYSEETGNRLAGMRPVKEPEPGMFDNFLAGSGQIAMQTFAKAGRAASLALAPAAIGLDKAKSYLNDTAPSTEIQDKFFKSHDEIFGRAVDYWTPKPNEVGAAGQVVGQVLGTLPLVMANPAAAVASTQLSTGEDLVRKGVDAGTAQAVGGVQAAGLGLGIWVPILGQTLAQRVLLGGAGFNVAQGLATRAASAKILEGTPGAEDFKALDPTALTLDVLLGAAFGGIAHINPRMRAEGEAWQKRIAEWGKTLKPSEVDALAALRQAQHLNADSLPGKPVDVEDVNAHVDRMRQALDDLANDRPVNVEDMPAGRFEADAARRAEAEKVVDGWVEEAGPLPEPAKVSPPNTAPLGKIWYHGTTEENIKLLDSPMWFDSTKEGGFAADRASTAGGKIHEFQLDIKNPLRETELTKKLLQQIIKDWRLSGVDVEKIEGFLKNAKTEPGSEWWNVPDGLKQSLLKNGFDSVITDKNYKNPWAISLKPKEQVIGLVKSAPEAGKPVAEAGDAQAGNADPLAASAARFAAENPDLPIVIGKNADGSDITTTPRQWLEDADATMRQAQEDASLFEIAAGCLLGGGR